MLKEKVPYRDLGADYYSVINQEKLIQRNLRSLEKLGVNIIKAAENCIRPFVTGRKNWLFSGSPKGAAASAEIYTLVETAKANGLVPMKYIKYILADMPGSAFLEHPEYLDAYLPWNPMIKEFCQ